LFLMIIDVPSLLDFLSVKAITDCSFCIRQQTQWTLDYVVGENDCSGFKNKIR
jgi:hypothetical protein